jgi:hypothetical protein
MIAGGCMRFTHRTKWKTQRAQQTVRFWSTEVLRMMVFAGSSIFAGSCFHVMFTFRVPRPIW